jgi:hypothetical protein
MIVFLLLSFFPHRWLRSAMPMSQRCRQTIAMMVDRQVLALVRLFAFLAFRF